MTESEKAYQYFVIAVPENEEQAKAYFWARKGISALRSVSREQELETENKELKERIVNWRKYMAPTREQAEKAWRSEWKPFAESAYGKQYKCPNCHTRTSSCSNFCPHCGAPMSDEAVQMVMERLEVVCSEAKAD